MRKIDTSTPYKINSTNLRPVACYKQGRTSTCILRQMSSTGSAVNLTSVHQAVVVAQLVEWLLGTPEIRGLKLVIGKILSTNCTIKNRKDKNKEK